MSQPHGLLSEYGTVPRHGGVPPDRDAVQFGATTERVRNGRPAIKVQPDTFGALDRRTLELSEGRLDRVAPVGRNVLAYGPDTRRNKEPRGKREAKT